MMYRFLVPGPPVAWRRARRAGKRSFTDPKLREWAGLVRDAAAKAGVPYLDDAPVALFVWGFWPLPKTKARKRKPCPVAWRPQVPDYDNLSKGIADALNGVVWADDAQVVIGSSATLTAAQGDPPRTVVEIKVLDKDAGEVVPRRVLEWRC